MLKYLPSPDLNQPLLWNYDPVVRREVTRCKCFSPHAADEVSNYSVTTLAIVIVAPIIVLIVLSAIAILVFRRIHNNQMERLTSRDAEYGTIDGLIASNVGESTLAVSSGNHVGGGGLHSSLERIVKEQLRAYFNWLPCWILSQIEIPVFYLNPPFSLWGINWPQSPVRHITSACLKWWIQTVQCLHVPRNRVGLTECHQAHEEETMERDLNWVGFTDLKHVICTVLFEQGCVVSENVYPSRI